MSEPTLEPELPIIDSHHHLFDKATGLLGRAMGYERFLIDEYTEFVDDGHNVVGSVIVESPGMDSIVGPEDERWVGATQFLAGQAAMASTGRYRGIRVAAGIEGNGFRRFSKLTWPPGRTTSRASARRQCGTPTRRC